MPIVGDIVRLRFRFLDADGDPLAVDDTPTLYLKRGSTVVSNDVATLTSESFEEWFYYDYLTTAPAVIFARAKTTDVLAAGDGTTDPITFEVDKFHFTGAEGSEKVNSIDSSAAAAIAALGASATIVSPVRTVGGEYRLDLKHGQTHSVAAGTAIQMTFTGIVDTTGGACVLTLTDLHGKALSITDLGNPYTGSLGTWSGGTVTATWEMTAAQALLLPVSKDNKSDLQKLLRFEVKITDSSGNVLKPVTPTVGDVTVFTGAYSS